VKPYGVRNTNGYRYILFQVWDFEGEYYDLTFYIIEENTLTQEVRTHALRSRYYAISTVKLLDLMSEAGFEDVKRIDDVYFQPILIGTKARLANACRRTHYSSLRSQQCAADAGS
jgi:hypothetical protein